jgi:dihydroorotate dehydrogenase electron transfer subunit
MTRLAGTQAEPRTLAPPERRVARVVSNAEVGAYRLIAADDPGGPADPSPGQFYMLAAAERWSGVEDGRPYLPRAFSYARARQAEAAVRLEFLLDAIGPGTERLAALAPGEGLALVGPLGVGFRVEEGERPALFVGGGIGTAPMLCLQDALPGASVLLGFRSAAHAEAADLFDHPRVVTDDGSRGRQALVTELLSEELEREPGAQVFACGPPPMLEAVRLLCAERGVPAQLALESGMACGFGACFGCVVPTRDGYLRLCLEGPVLDAERLESALFPGAGH